MSEYFETILSKYQWGFRKEFSAQCCLLAMLEKWKSAIGDKKIFGALLTDLSKAFDWLSHDLLIAYGWHKAIYQRKKTKSKINSKFSSWEENLFGLP